jgi:hypothetical protein
MFHHNHFFFLRTLWGALHHADWKEAAARGGILRLIAEFFRAITGFSAWPFFISAESGWEPSSIQSILNEHGIPNWGWGKHKGEFFFQVKLRQASWAQYLLQQHGVPLSGQLLDEGGRSAYRPAARPSLRAVAGATSRHGSTPHTLDKPVAKPEATPSLLTDPVGQINRTVDRLAKW